MTPTRIELKRIPGNSSTDSLGGHDDHSHPHPHPHPEDRLTREVEKGVVDEGLSPMSPPFPYAPPAKPEIPPFEKLPAMLQKFTREHQRFSEALNRFEEALVAFRGSNWKITREIQDCFRDFFSMTDKEIVDHHEREEKVLFPMLHRRLIEVGESSPRTPAHPVVTPVSVMQDEHHKISHITNLVFNFLGFASRLTDFHSRTLVYEIIFDQGQALVEHLKLHIFREDNILFPLACKHFNEVDFEFLKRENEKYFGLPLI